MNRTSQNAYDRNIGFQFPFPSEVIRETPTSSWIPFHCMNPAKIPFSKAKRWSAHSAREIVPKPLARWAVIWKTHSIQLGDQGGAPESGRRERRFSGRHDAAVIPMPVRKVTVSTGSSSLQQDDRIGGPY